MNERFFELLNESTVEEGFLKNIKKYKNKYDDLIAKNEAKMAKAAAEKANRENPEGKYYTCKTQQEVDMIIKEFENFAKFCALMIKNAGFKLLIDKMEFTPKKDSLDEYWRYHASLDLVNFHDSQNAKKCLNETDEEVSEIDGSVFYDWCEEKFLKKIFTKYRLDEVSYTYMIHPKYEDIISAGFTDGFESFGVDVDFIIKKEI